MYYVTYPPYTHAPSLTGHTTINTYLVHDNYIELVHSIAVRSCPSQNGF